MKYVSKLCVSILISQFVIQISWIPCICIYWPLCLVYCCVESSWLTLPRLSYCIKSGLNLAMMAQSARPDLQSSDPAYPSVSRAHQDIRSGGWSSGGWSSRTERGCYFDKDVMHNVMSYDPSDTCHHMTFCYKHWFLLRRIIFNFSFGSSPLHECHMALNFFTHRGEKGLFLKNIVTLTVRFLFGPARF